FHHTASKLRIFRFEPFKQSLIARTPTIKLRCFRILYRLPSTLSCKLQAQYIAHETPPTVPPSPQLSVEWYHHHAPIAALWPGKYAPTADLTFPYSASSIHLNLRRGKGLRSFDALLLIQSKV